MLSFKDLISPVSSQISATYRWQNETLVDKQLLNLSGAVIPHPTNGVIASQLSEIQLSWSSIVKLQPILETANQVPAD